MLVSGSVIGGAGCFWGPLLGGGIFFEVAIDLEVLRRC